MWHCKSNWKRSMLPTRIQAHVMVSWYFKHTGWYEGPISFKSWITNPLSFKSQITFSLFQTILQITLSQVCYKVSACDYLRLLYVTPSRAPRSPEPTIFDDSFKRFFFLLNMLSLNFSWSELVCRLAVTLLQKYFLEIHIDFTSLFDCGKQEKSAHEIPWPGSCLFSVSPSSIRLFTPQSEGWKQVNNFKLIQLQLFYILFTVLVLYFLYHRKVSEQIRLLSIRNALHQETQALFEYPYVRNRFCFTSNIFLCYCFLILSNYFFC